MAAEHLLAIAVSLYAVLNVLNGNYFQGFFSATWLRSLPVFRFFIGVVRCARFDSETFASHFCVARVHETCSLSGIFSLGFLLAACRRLLMRYKGHYIIASA